MSVRIDCLFFDDAIKMIFFAFKISLRERLILSKSKCLSLNEIILFWDLIASDVFKQSGKIDAKWPSSPIPNTAKS